MTTHRLPQHRSLATKVLQLVLGLVVVLAYFGLAVGRPASAHDVDVSHQPPTVLRSLPAVQHSQLPAVQHVQLPAVQRGLR